jgi:hypothetical protein
MKKRTLTGISAVALIVSMGASLAQNAPGGSAAPSPADSGRQLQTTPTSPDRGVGRERSSQQQTPPAQRQEAPPARAESPSDRSGSQRAQPSSTPGQDGSPSRAQSPSDRASPQQAQPAQRGQDGQNSPSRAQSPSDRASPQQAQPTQRGQGGQDSPSRAQSPSDRASPQQAQPAQRGQDGQNSPSRAQSPSDRASPQQAQPSTSPGQRSPGSTAGSGSDTTVTGSISSNPEQATRLRQSVEQARVPEARVDVNVRVGATLPRSVTLVAPPPALIEIAPRYRDYRVVRVRDELIIVEPGSYRVVEVVRLSGGRTGQSGSMGTLTLTREQQEIVRRHARQARVTSTQRIEVREGRPLAAEVELHTLPSEVFVEVPELREYRYVVTGDQIVIVNPQTRIVTEVIR